MRLSFTRTYTHNLLMLLRKCGYVPSHNRAGEPSFVRAMGPGGYPRFHCYVDSLETGFSVHLHLDQKKPTYGSHTAHSGEYDGPAVEAEAARMSGIINSFENIS